jgi:hypothetical protein
MVPDLRRKPSGPNQKGGSVDSGMGGDMSNIATSIEKSAPWDELLSEYELVPVV